MERLLVGCGILAASLGACGESSKPRVAGSDGGAGGENSSARDAGSGSGASAGSGSGGDLGAGDAGASSSELTPYFAAGSRLKPIVFALDGGPDVLVSNSSNGAWYDSELELECLFMPDEAGVERCFPFALMGATTYSDAECKRRVVALSDQGPCTGLRYPYLASDSPGKCGLSGWRVGAELPATTSVFASFDGSCQPQAGTYGQIYELEPVPPETFVSQRRGQRPRAPGLDAYVREGEDGSWEIVGYVDPTREAPCFEARGAFKSPSNCLPSYIGWSGDFASGCEQPIVRSVPGLCDLEPPRVIAHLELDASSCPTVYDIELYEIDGTEEVVPYQLDSSGACAANGFPQAASYLQGTAIDVSTLPTLQTMTVGSGQVRAAFTGFGDVPYLPSVSSGPLIDASGALCQPFRLSDGELHCLTLPLAGVAAANFVYEDADCSGARVAPWARKCPGDSTLPSLVVVPDENAPCANPPVFSEVIAVVGESAASAFYAKNLTTGACEPVPEAQATGPHLLLGEPVNPELLPPLEKVTRP